MVMPSSDVRSLEDSLGSRSHRPFRFGVQLGGPADAAGWVEQARRIEDLGYSTVTMPDHFTDQLAPMPALSAAAAVTTTLRIGALVFDNDYKHPAVLAKELATQDVLSGGRVEIGLGAGWMETDYRSIGMAYDRPGVRIDRFEEGIAVIKGAMADGPFSFAGRHYTITDYDGRPKPVQRPHPPLLIGGGGAGSCPSPPARPTSSASTATWRPAPSVPTRSPR